MVQQFNAERNKRLTERQQAAERKSKAKQYAKLVAELVDVHATKPPADPTVRSSSARAAAKKPAAGGGAPVAGSSSALRMPSPPRGA